jgi:hypothetical protein
VRKALTIFIIILLMPSLLSGIGNLVVFAQGGGGGGGSPGGLGQFIATLQTLIPAALILLAILANRYDQRYALVLFAAAIASAIFLAAAGQTALSFYSPGSTEYISLSISGPTTVYVGQSGTWTINASASWYIMNSSNGAKVASGSGTTITWTANSPGKYIIVATNILTQGNVTIYEYGSYIFSSEYPPSPLGWIQGAITSAFKSLINDIVGGFSFLGGIFATNIVPIDNFVYSPSPNSLTDVIYSKIEQIMTGLAMLLIAASVAYNAIRGFYNDLVDLGADVMYKLSVWALFTTSGLTIYTYAAGLLNFLIKVTVGSYINAIAGEMFTSIATYWSIFGLSNALGLGFARALSNYATDVVIFYLVFVALAFVRYAALLAAVSLIPLASTLWLFEWTRPIAGVIVDLIVGLMMSGLISGITFAMLEAMGVGIVIFLVGPVLGGIEFAISLYLTFVSIKPHERLHSVVKSTKG